MLIPKVGLMVADVIEKGGVHDNVQLREGSMTVATNGHILVVFEPKGVPEVEEFPSVGAQRGAQHVTPVEPLTIPGQACKEIEKSLPKRANIPVLGYAALVECHNGNGEARHELVTTDLENVRNFRVGREGFPNWPRVVPNGEPQARVGLSVAALATIVKMLARMGRESVTIEVRGEETAVVMHSKQEDGNTTVVVMPYRGRP